VSVAAGRRGDFSEEDFEKRVKDACMRIQFSLADEADVEEELKKQRGIEEGLKQQRGLAEQFRLRQEQQQKPIDNNDFGGNDFGGLGGYVPVSQRGSIEGKYPTYRI
jgi:hypothetical protein